MYQDILEQAERATGVRQVAMTRLDHTAKKVNIVAVTGLGIRTFQSALAAVRRIVPGFDILKISFDVDANELNQAIYLRGEVVQAPITEVAASVVPRPVLALASRLYGTNESLVVPLRVDGEIFGSIGFNSRERLTEKQRITCESFARQAELTLENAQLRRLVAMRNQDFERSRHSTMKAESVAREILADTNTTGVITRGNLSLDRSAKSVKYRDDRIELTPRQYALLEFFMGNAGRALAREQMALAVWGHPETDSSNVVDVAVMHLRRNLEAAGRPRLIHSVRGYGYIFEER